MEPEENAYVRNIVKEISRECAPRKIDVNKNFLTYLTKILLINPNWGIDNDFFNQRQNVQIFVRYVIDELLVNPHHPNMVTLKIQFYFSCNLDNMEFVVELDRYNLRKKLSTLKDDICSTGKMADKEEIDKLYRKIVFYITLLSGLGNPINIKVYEEGLVALKSILNENELKDFVGSSNSFKVASLENYVKIVSGIRLFNKHCEKGGEGIENLPRLLKRALSVIKQKSEFTLLQVMEKVNILTTLVDQCYEMKSTNVKGIQLEFVPPKEWQSTFNIIYFKDLLIFLRQYELIIRKLIEEIDQIVSRMESIVKSMEKLLQKIHDTVYMRLAIPVVVVFPLFKELSDIWTRIQDQVVLLARFGHIMTNLEMYASQVHDEDSPESLFEESVSLTDAERLKLTAHQRITSDNPEVTIYSAESFRNMDILKLEYLGFCCWKLIKTKGALIPGNPSMGIARYKGKNFVFSTIEASEEFCKDPQLYINYVLDLAREKPQLIHFLQLKEELERVYSIDHLVQSRTDLRMCEDKAVETEEQLEKYIDPSYKWNIWDYKREVLRLANLLSCKTVTVQTDKVISKLSVRNQTYTKIGRGMSTMKDEHTNVPTPSNYIYGLRGRKDDQQFIADLTLPIDNS